MRQRVPPHALLSSRALHVSLKASQFPGKLFHCRQCGGESQPTAPSLSLLLCSRRRTPRALEGRGDACSSTETSGCTRFPPWRCPSAALLSPWACISLPWQACSQPPTSSTRLHSYHHASHVCGPLRFVSGRLISKAQAISEWLAIALKKSDSSSAILNCHSLRGESRTHSPFPVCDVTLRARAYEVLCR